VLSDQVSPDWKIIQGFTKDGYAFVKTKEFASSIHEMTESGLLAEEDLKREKSVPEGRTGDG
jgi:DNA primase large subunit